MQNAMLLRQIVGQTKILGLPVLIVHKGVVNSVVSRVEAVATPCDVSITTLSKYEQFQAIYGFLVHQIAAGPSM